MDAIDLSDVTVALPDVGTGLEMGPGALAWVVSAHLLGYGGFLLLGGAPPTCSDAAGPSWCP